MGQIKGVVIFLDFHKVWGDDNRVRAMGRTKKMILKEHFCVFRDRSKSFPNKFTIEILSPKTELEIRSFRGAFSLKLHKSKEFSSALKNVNQI